MLLPPLFFLIMEPETPAAFPVCFDALPGICYNPFMFTLWGKLYKGNRITGDLTVQDPSADTRTHKVFAALDTICRHFDLAQPVWLETNITEFRRRSRTRFSQDNFMEDISFDYLEIQILEED